MSKLNKKLTGSFYSTNSEELFEIVFEDFLKFYNNNPKIICEPCCGDGDIVNFLKSKNIYNIECFDIINNIVPNVKIQDTILNSPDYDNKYIITNPPYLSKNKMPKNFKTKYENFTDWSDLYELYIKELIKSNCNGGILILPSNFIFSYRSDLRKQFIQKYKINILKIFEKQIFNDTTQTVVVFDFFNRKLLEEKQKNNFIINTYLITKEKTENFNIEISKNNNYSYGSELYNLKYKSNLKLSRYIKDDLEENKMFLTNIEITTLDPNMKAYYVDNPVKNKITDRTRITIISSEKLEENQQKYIIKKFNEKLLKYRIKYHSLFMSSFREFSRKRLNFDLIYTFLKNIINKMFETLNTVEVNNKIVRKLCEISNFDTFTENYKFLQYHLDNINIKHLLENYKTEQYLKKYKIYYNNYSFLVKKYKTFEDFKDYVFNNINDPLIQSIFIKKNIRQSIHEIIQIFLMENKLNMKFETNIKDKLSKTKSFDGKNIENKIYLCCKFIKDYGGNQDNQINDLLLFNEYSEETDYLIYLVVSGDYGINKIKKLNPKLNKNVKIIYLF
jgi:hypothetical protein